MKVRHFVATTLAVFLSTTASLFAHNGKIHVKGTVTASDAKQIVVKEEKGKSISIRVNRDTVYQRNESGAPAASADLRVGDRVVIDSFGMSGGEQTAMEIHFSAPLDVDRHKGAGHPSLWRNEE